MHKILFVSAVSYLKGGAERVLLDMLANPNIDAALALPERGELTDIAAERGVQVVYFTPRAISQIHRPLRLSVVLRSIPDVFRCSARLRTAARELGCEVIHSNGLKVHVLATFAALFRHKLRTVVHLHDIAYSMPERCVWRLLGKLADRVAIVSRPCWPDAGVPENVRIVPNGVVPPPQSACVQAAVAQSQSRTAPFQLGFVGRFHQHKGLLLLLEWAAAARAAGLDFQLRLRGGPDPMQPEYWERVQSRLHTSGLDRITALDGWQAGEKVYEGLDALVVPSDHPDPLPRVVMEAGARALPVIALPSGGIPTMIVEGTTGFLVRDTNEFVDRLRRLVEDPGFCAEMGAAAREFVGREFTLRRFHERFDTLYAELDSEEPPPRSLQQH